MNFIPLFLPLLLLLFPGANALPENSTNSTSHPIGSGWDFSWSSITPNRSLTYHPCYEDFLCARLLLPLDYLSENTPSAPQATVAIIKLPSTSSQEYTTNWGGPLFTNPGGPGGSGVEFVLSSGKALQSIVGSQFSIVGVDPRGVNNTLPSVSCFGTDFERNLWGLKGGNSVKVAGAGDDPEKIGEAYVRGAMLGQMCSTGEGAAWAGVKGDAGRFIGTTSTARDMYEINKAEWALCGTQKGLHYWGFSYGSILGLTYAKLFPGSVEKLVVDGVADVSDFLTISAKENLRDTDKVLDSFYSMCSAAGPLACQFHTGTTPAQIRKRLEKLMSALRKQPLSYYIPTGTASDISQPDLFTLADLRFFIFTSLYSPVSSFTKLATVLTKIENVLSLTPTGSLPLDLLPNWKATLQPTCPVPGAPTEISAGGDENQAGILCSDAPPQHNMTLPNFQNVVARLRKQSPMVGDIWAAKMLPCITWPHQAKWKVPLDQFVPPLSNATWPSNKPPILLLSTSLDPVTPLHNAHAMAKLFPNNGTVVAVQEGEGHCTTSAVSSCMIGLVKKFFAEGVVDGHGTRVCARESAPFSEVASVTLRDEDAIKADAMKRVGREVLKIAVRGKGNAWWI